MAAYPVATSSGTSTTEQEELEQEELEHAGELEQEEIWKEIEATSPRRFEQSFSTRLKKKQSRRRKKAEDAARVRRAAEDAIVEETWMVSVKDGRKGYVVRAGKWGAQ